jgi:hypothetical protein
MGCLQLRAKGIGVQNSANRLADEGVLGYEGPRANTPRTEVRNGDVTP